MVGAVREMVRLLAEAHPFLAPYIKISCEKGTDCQRCKGSGFTWVDGIAADQSEVASYHRMSSDTRKSLGEQHQIIVCQSCNGIGSLDRRCTFQDWENVEGQCDFPWAKQNNRVFLPNPKFRIGGK